MSSSVEDELATNWFMEFRYPQQQENFLLFRAEQYGKGFITSIVASGITIGLTLNTVLSVHSHPNVLTSVISMSFLSITAFLVWSIVYIKSRPPSYEGTKQKNALQLLENAFLLAFSIGLDLTLVMRLLNGSCVNSLFINTWACIPSNISRSLPGDTVLCIIFIPLLCCMMLPYINKRLAAAIYVPNISFVIWALVYERATSPVTWIFLACCISLSLLYVYTMTQVQLYKYFARTKKLRQQREDIMRMKSDELKSVLGKIAHDLKTPLTSLNYGLESMMELLQRVEVKDSDTRTGPSLNTSPRKPPLPTIPEGSSVHSASLLLDQKTTSSQCVAMLNDNWHDMNSTLDGMRVSHMYVMVILNRCLDYSRLVNNVPLMPRIAPVSLRQILQKSLQWANKMYDHRQVVVEKFAVGSCDSILSDPVWLQENFICVLSNALKFSESGLVKVRFFKQQEVIIKDLAAVDLEHAVEEECDLNKQNEDRCSKNTTDPRANSEGEESCRVDDIELGLSLTNLREAKDDSSGSYRVRSSPTRGLLDVLRVEVEDFGTSLTEDIARSLFSAPAGDEERLMGGSGLGLFCLAERIKALNGRYGVVLGDSASTSSNQSSLITANTECRGNVIWFSIPLQPASHGSSYGSVDLQEMTRSYRESDWVESMRRLAVPESKNVCANTIEANTIEETNMAESKSPTSYVSEMPIRDDCDTGNLGDKRSVAESPVSVFSGSSDRDSISAQSERTHQLPVTSSALVPSPAQTPSLKILIVDDSPLILKMLKSVLEKKGHDVTVTPNGYEALDLIGASWRSEQERLQTQLRASSDTDAPHYGEQHTMSTSEAGTFDVMLLDIQMPIIDGLEVMNQYRSRLQQVCDESGAEPPGLLIIAMSANSDSDTMESAIQAGADFFFGKPFDVEAFHKVVRKKKKEQR